MSTNPCAYVFKWIQYTVPQLKKEAKNNNIAGYTKMKKVELIEALSNKHAGIAAPSKIKQSKKSSKKSKKKGKQSSKKSNKSSKRKNKQSKKNTQNIQPIENKPPPTIPPIPEPKKKAKKRVLVPEIIDNEQPQPKHNFFNLFNPPAVQPAPQPPPAAAQPELSVLDKHVNTYGENLTEDEEEKAVKNAKKQYNKLLKKYKNTKKLKEHLFNYWKKNAPDMEMLHFNMVYSNLFVQYRTQYAKKFIAAKGLRGFVNLIKNLMKKNKPFLYFTDFAIPEWFIAYDHATQEIQAGHELTLPSKMQLI